MQNFPPNINWRWTTLLATALGFLTSGNLTAHEQIALGNWIVQIGQTVLTNSTYQQLIEYRIMGNENINLNSEEFKCGGSPFINNHQKIDINSLFETFKAQITEEELSELQMAINRINEEISKIIEEKNKKT